MPRPKRNEREPSLIVELRATIEESGANPYQIAAKAGIDESGVRKFLARTRSLSLDSGARLADALGMKILRPKVPRKFDGRKRRRARTSEQVPSEMVKNGIESVEFDPSQGTGEDPRRIDYPDSKTLESVA